MKIYKITKKSPDQIFIINEDKNPIITKIECDIILFTGIYNTCQKLWSVRIDLYNETSDMRALFYTVPDITRSKWMGYEALILQKDMKNIVELFKIIQQVDPIPLSAISEIMELIDFDLSELLNMESMMNEAMLGHHHDALKYGLEAHEKGNNEALANLANFYQDKNDEANYINVLSNIPQNHPSFKQANEEILTYQQNLSIPQDECKKINISSSMFYKIYNAV
ncbi:MAG: hypothetical protein H0W64_01345 [Gammaproteobacteria bacterium]|nr:hypothetical protein [Gammaproteobacteria bacterium]